MPRPAPHSPRLLVAAVAAGAIALTAAVPAPTTVTAAVIPDPVPDRGPVLSQPIARGEVVLAAPTTRKPTPKAADGDLTDWVGSAARVGGAVVWDAGEHVHSDFLFDAHGADDGRDRDRLAQFADLLYVEDRASRVDQLLRTSGSQLGVPEPLGAPDEYGDVAGGLEVADLTEVRWAAADRQGKRLALLARVANLTDPARLGVLVLADLDAAARVDGPVEVGLGTGLVTQRFDRAVLLTAAGVAGRDLTTGADLDPKRDLKASQVAVTAAGWDNALEAVLPAGVLTGADGAFDVAVVAGRIEDDGSFTPLNVAYRHAEPLEIWNDRLQALDLLERTVDRFSSGPIAVADLTAGRTQPLAHLGPGYHERQLRSDEAISRESGRNGIWQPYGLYVPTAHVPGEILPVTYWLHYRGGKAHSGVVINPRLVTQLGEEPGHLMVFPNGRGTSEWYVTESHQDVWEVMGDAETLIPIDPLRRYVSGYSMGGYGSWLFATLYPDLFAAAFVQSGAVTQGAWLGGGPDDEPDPFFDAGWVEANDGDARAQLTYRALENLRHVPFVIDHGTNDELALNPQVERMALKLTELGYEHRFTRYLGYEHFTQAIVDEWADGAAYLAGRMIDPNPREVTYAVVPVLTWAVNHVDAPAGASFEFRPDGAYWVDEVVAREVPIVDAATGRPADHVKAIVDAISEAIPAPLRLPVVDTGVASPPGHSTPYVRSGLTYVDVPADTGLEPPVANRLVLDLTNVASVGVDVARAALEIADGVAVGLALTTDGPATIRLVGANAAPSVWDAAVVTGGAVELRRDGADLLVVLPEAGTYGITAG
jgi:dienelactone hydrolase